MRGESDDRRGYEHQHHRHRLQLLHGPWWSQPQLITIRPQPHQLRELDDRHLFL